MKVFFFISKLKFESEIFFIYQKKRKLCMKNAHRIQAQIYAYINLILFHLTASSLPRLVSPIFIHSRLSLFLFY
jgi:hypothetical protein